MRKLVIGLVLLLAGLVVGFVPQHMKARHFELQANVCDSRLQLAEVRRLSALTYVAATQLNYGTASDYAKQLFDRAQDLANTSSDATVRSNVTDVLASRDKVTTDLAKGNSQVVSELQPLLVEVQGGK